MPMKPGHCPRKEVMQNGSAGKMPSCTDRKEAWAEDRLCAIAQAVHTQASTQEVQVTANV
jgi:hypothetical protein